MTRRHAASILLFAFALLVGSTSFAQALPGYERTRIDQIRDEKNRRAIEMEGDADVMDELSALDLDAWKAGAVTWGLARHVGGQLTVTSKSEHFADLETVRTRRDSAAPSDRLVLAADDPRDDLWLGLPERVKAAELRCRLDGLAGGELFGVFLVEGRRYVCHTRPAADGD